MDEQEPTQSSHYPKRKDVYYGVNADRGFALTPPFTGVWWQTWSHRNDKTNGSHPNNGLYGPVMYSFMYAFRYIQTNVRDETKIE